MKNFLIIANWKINNSTDMVQTFLTSLQSYLSLNKQKNDIALAPSFIYLEQIYRRMHHKNVFLAAQNVDINLKGAFTGEISVLMLQDMGVKYVILGHSERRQFHHETDNIIAKKFKIVKKYQLVPILCIGETKEEKELEKTEYVISNQIDLIFNICGETAFRNTVIAYEPIWAIGNSHPANPKDVQKIHKFIKNYIFKKDPISINSLIIQYGGSINSDNAKKFIEQPDIDGLLIGRASLKYEEFVNILDIANKFI